MLSNCYVIVAERSVVATDVIICVSIVFIVYYSCTSDRRATAVSRCLHRTVVTHTLRSKRIDLTTKYFETAKANSCTAGNRFTSTTCCERHGVVIYIIIESNVKINSRNYNNNKNNLFSQRELIAGTLCT